MEKKQPPVQDEPQLYKAYEYLREQDVAVPDDYKEFEKAMQDDAKLKHLHDYFKGQDIAVPESYDEFKTGILTVKKKDEPAAASPKEEVSSSASGPVSPKDAYASILPSETSGEEASSFTDQKLAPVEVVGEKPKDWVPTPAEMAEDKAMGAYGAILPGQQPFQPGDVAPETNPVQTAWKTLKDSFFNRIPAAAAGAVAALTPDNATQIGPGGFLPLPKEDVERNKKAIEASSKALVKFAAGKMDESAKVALIRSYKQVDNPLDALNYVVQIGTQGATDIATTIGTGGVSSFINEVGNNYMDGVMEIAKDKGITPEQVIEQNLDDPASAIVFGTIQAALDKIGADEVVKAIGREPIVKELKRRGMSILKEAGTEVVQEVLGATSTAVATKNPSKIIEDPSRYVDAALGGGVGAGTFMAPDLAARGLRAAIAPSPAQAGRRLMEAEGKVKKEDVLNKVDKSIEAYKNIIANPSENDTQADLQRYNDNITKLEAYRKTVLPDAVNYQPTLPEILPQIQESVQAVADGPDKIAAAQEAAKIIAEQTQAPAPAPATPAKPKGNEDVARIANGYATRVGLPEIDPVPLKKLNVDNSKTIADEYEAMEHRPQDPEVQSAYRALKDETLAQHDDLVAAGYVMEPWEKEGQPYANSGEMMDDVRNNKHVYYFKTEDGFGSGQMDVSENPMLEQAPDGRPYNDIFRAVHDIMGHAKIGNQFGPLGEENAWRIHAQMYSPEARKAMTTETRGQNSWVNFGPHMRNADGSIKKEGDEGFLSVTERPYAPQKVGLLPARVWDKDLAEPALAVGGTVDLTTATPDLDPDAQIARGKEKLKAILAGRNGKIYDVTGLGVDLVDALKDIAVGYIRKGVGTAADFVREFKTDNPELWDIESDDLEEIYNGVNTTNSASVRDNGAAETSDNAGSDTSTEPAAEPVRKKKKAAKRRTGRLAKRAIKTEWGTDEVRARIKAEGYDYDVLKTADTLKEVRKITRAFGLNLTGLNNAITAVNNRSLDISEVTRTGMAVDIANFAKAIANKYRTNEADKEKLNAWLQIEYQAVKWLTSDGGVRDYGRAINMVKKLETSPETFFRKEVEDIIQRNEEILNRKPVTATATPAERIRATKKEVDRITKDAVDGVVTSPAVTKKVKEIHEKKPAKQKEPGYGDQNKLVSKSKYQQLLKELRGSAFSGVDPRYVQIGLYHIEAGTRKFGAFSKRMIKDLGEGIKPKLKEIYLAAANQALDTGTVAVSEFKQLNKPGRPVAPHEVMAQRILSLVREPDQKAQGPQSRMLSILMGKVTEKLPKRSASGQPLTPTQKIQESLANRELYGEVWENTKGEVTDLVETDMTMDEFEKEAVLLALDDFYNEYIGQPFSNSVVQSAIRNLRISLKGVEFKKASTDSINRIVTDYLTNQVGVTGADAIDLRNAVIREFNKQVVDAQNKALDRPENLVKAELADLQASIRDIVAKHYSKVDELKTTLVEKFINEAGMTGPEATSLATIIEAEFDKQTRDAKTRVLSNMFPSSNLLPKVVKKQLSEMERILKATNLGVLDDNTFTDMFAEKFGLTRMNDEVKDRIRAFANAIQTQPNREKRNREMQAFVDYLDTLDNSTAQNLANWATSIFYVNILSGLTTFARNIKGMGMTVPVSVGQEYLRTVYKNPSQFLQVNKAMLHALSNGLSLGRTAFKDIVRDGFNNTFYDPNKREATDKLTKFINKGNLKNPLTYLFYLPVKMVRGLAATDAMVVTTLREFKIMVDAYNSVLNDGTPLDPGQTFWDKVYQKYNGEDFDQAKAERQALDENPAASSTEIKKRIAEIKADLRDEDTVKSAVYFGQRATLNNDPEGLGGVFYELASMLTKVVPGTKFLLPILRIPTNAVNMWLDWNPIWALKRAIFGRGSTIPFMTKKSPNMARTFGKYHSEVTKESQINDAIRCAVSTAIYGMLLQNVFGDEEEPLFEITADGYGNWEKNQSLEKGDWKEFSFRILKPDGKYSRWISYKDSPLGMLFASIGYMSDGKKYQDMGAKGQGELIWSGLYNSVLFVKEQNYVQSMIDIAGVFEKSNSAGGKVEKFLVNQSTRMAKGLTYANFYQQLYRNFKATNNIADKQLTSTKESFTGALRDNLLSNVPFLEDQIGRNKIDALGMPVVQEFAIPFTPDHVARMVSDYDGFKKKEWLLVFNKKATVGFAEPTTYRKKPIPQADKIIIQRHVAEKMGEYVRKNYTKLEKLDNEDFQERLDKKKKFYMDRAKVKFLRKK